MLVRLDQYPIMLHNTVFLQVDEKDGMNIKLHCRMTGVHLSMWDFQSEIIASKHCRLL